MFRHTYQTGCMSLFYSLRSQPLKLWKKHAAYGHIKSVRDEDVDSYVLEIMGANVRMTGITCPSERSESLAIKLPYYVMIVKNLKRIFMFEVEVIDDKNLHRRFIASNFQSRIRVGPSDCMMPMKLDQGWNQVHFDLPACTRLAYGTKYVETVRVRVFANCRLRSVFFSDKLYPEESLSPEFKLFLPIQRDQRWNPTPLRR